MSDPASVRDILDVALEAYALKDTARTGWVKQGIREQRGPKAAESVAEHIALMNTLAVLFTPFYNERARNSGAPELDTGKLLQLITVHDLPEARIGDIPADGTENRALKQQQEEAVMGEYGQRTGHPALEALWREFEMGTTPEAAFARDLDKIEMFIQAYLYQASSPEAAGKLEQFWANDAAKVKTPVGREILSEIMQRRSRIEGRHLFAGNTTSSSSLQL